MATYNDVMNSGLLYAICIIILLLVVGICALFFIKSRKQALKYGITNEEIKAVCKSTLLLTIVPSIAIVVGLFSLCAVVGTPWAQLRLSVIGSFVYELLAAQMATSALGFADTAEALASSPTTFGTVMFIMSIGIVASPLLNAIICKPMTQGLRKAGSSGSKFSGIMSACFSIALFGVYIPVYCANGIVTVLVIATSALCGQLIGYLANKLNAKWLHEFNLSLCLIIGMLSSLLWTALVG